jgi:hypothetical protein
MRGRKGRGRTRRKVKRRKDGNPLQWVGEQSKQGQSDMHITCKKIILPSSADARNSPDGENLTTLTAFWCLCRSAANSTFTTPVICISACQICKMNHHN